MTNYYKRTSVALLLLLFVLTGCNSWLDITPKDRVNEEMLFESKEGYLKLLNGIYVELADAACYGENLSVGFIDIQGQYYNVAYNSHLYGTFADFSFTANQKIKTEVNNTWVKMYYLIANSNAIIEKCVEPNPILKGNYFNIVKGEAIALRAMLHFDLLRLYGPIYSIDKRADAIPYMKNSKNEVTSIYSAEEVLKFVIEDLIEARDLLKSVDPILTDGVLHLDDPKGVNDFNYRQYRLNYFAVNALLARAYLWGGDKEKAFECAKLVIDEGRSAGKEIFPAVTNAAATNATNPDRIYSTEVIFGVYHSNRKAIHTKYFSSDLADLSRLYTHATSLTSGRLSNTYPDKNDYRYKFWWTNVPGSTSAIYFRKFENVNLPGRYMMPLIRISEMYFICAECSENIDDAIQYINAVRKTRGCININAGDEAALTTAITDEFRREMTGEGQMFYYYKRKAMLLIPNGRSTMNRPMTIENYKWPLPDSETSQRD